MQIPVYLSNKFHSFYLIIILHLKFSYALKISRHLADYCTHRWYVNRCCKVVLFHSIQHTCKLLQCILICQQLIFNLICLVWILQYILLSLPSLCCACLFRSTQLPAHHALLRSRCSSNLKLNLLCWQWDAPTCSPTFYSQNSTVPLPKPVFCSFWCSYMCLYH